MREWLLLALAATSIACSGGRDPVDTVGGDGEYEGPGASDPFGAADPSPTTSTSALVALCTKACAHLHAADCNGAPAYATYTCEGRCSNEVNELGPGSSCADEAAAVYACSLDAKVTCTDALGNLPTVKACDDEVSDLEKCRSPGSDCMTVSVQAEVTCIELGLPEFMVCSEGIEPPSNCFQISSTGFCCP
jgi:hypothetical protein